MSIKITMIGLTNAGKTCYLVGTTAQMLEGISGFEFVPTNYDQGLQLENMWDSLCDNDARWFSGTAATTQEYVFRCLFNGRSLTPDSSDSLFTWVDYRGGLLQQQGGDDPETEIGRLYQRCSDSDALIVAIPGDILVECVQNPDSQTVARMLRRYKNVLQTLRAQDVENFQQKAIILTITKSDCIGSKDEMIACLRKIKDTFSFCFGESQRAGMITAVSLGKFGSGAAQGQKIDGKISPSNLHLPILLPFDLWIRESEENARQNVRSSNSSASEESNKSWLGKFFSGDNSDYYYEQAAEYQKLAEALLETANSIESEFVDSVILYQYGVRTFGIKGVDI